MIQGIGLDEFGGPDVLHFVDLDLPEPGPREVRVRVHNVGVNPSDITFRRGGRAAQLTSRARPLIPGMDVCGVVDAVGPGTDGRFSVGDRVIAYVNPLGERGGTYAEYIAVDERSLAAAPANASDAEAATLLLNAVTAHLALAALGPPVGGTLAVTGGAGAVGGYSIQLAKSRGWSVISDASPRDEALIRELGADQLVARGHDVGERILHLKPRGVDGIIDGSDQRDAVASAIAPGGVLASLKGWGGPSAQTGIKVSVVSSFGSAQDHGLFEDLRRLAEGGVLTCRVAGVLPAAQAAEAHRLLEQGGLRGRLVLCF